MYSDPSCLETRSDIVSLRAVRRFARNYAKFNHQQRYWNANGIQGLVTGLPENLRAASLQNPYQRLPQIYLYEYHRQHQVRLRQIRMKRKSIWNT
jgi:hypothetical protein